MLRKLILASVATVAVAAGFAAFPSNAQALPPGYGGYGWNSGYGGYRHDHDHRHGNHRVRYEVVYRHRGHFDVYGTYRDADDAYRAARRLRYNGYYGVEVRRVAR